MILLLPTLLRFKWECVKSIGLFVLGVALARWVGKTVNISILHLEIFQRHAGPKCRQSVMEASSQFYSDNKTLSESQFPGRRGDCQIVKLSSFIVLKPSYSKTLSVSDRQFHHECK